MKLASWPRAFASRSSASSNASIRCSSSNSSRRWVRIISGPSVAIVNATPCSTNARKVSRTASSSGSAFVKRFDVGQISRTIPASLMGAPSEAGIVLEICPTSNLLTKALPDEDAVRETFRAFVEHGVAFTIATDGPEMMRTHLRDVFELLQRLDALDEAELREANARGHEASFIRARPLVATV